MKIPVLTAEVWAAIPGFLGYEASTFGRIRSYRSLNGRGPLCSVPHILKQSSMKPKVYLQVTLCLGDGSQKQMQVHQLILITFIGPRPNPKLDACHKDGNGANNSITNLRWDTKKANALDRVKHGTQLLGSKSKKAVLTDEQVRQIKTSLPVWKHGMGRKFAQLFNVGTSTISRIKNELSWKHL